jgi:NAD(P)H-dependent FMN reductase
MHILLINGSPRQGNTARLLTRLEDRLTARGFSTTTVHLGAQRVEACRGCYQCFLKGAELCRIKDDVDSIWRQMAEAEAVVFAAPVYSLGMPGTMKNLMDRLAWHAHRPSFYDKPALIVSTTAGMGTEQVIKQLKWFEIMGYRVADSQGFLTLPHGRDLPKVQARKDRQLDRLAAKLSRALLAPPKPKARLIKVLQFQGLKLNASFGRAVYHADHAFYEGKDFHPGVPTTAFQRAFGRLFFRMGTKALAATVEPGIPLDSV